MVEDDLSLGNTLKDFFECSGLVVFWAKDGETGLKYYNEKHPQLVLLDVILPGINGFEVIAKIRKLDTVVPVIFMTGSEFDAEAQINAFKLGAINYIKKPVIPEVLLAQILNLTLSASTKRYNFENCLITINNQMLTINDSVIKLRDKEAQILSLLLDNCNKVVTRNDLLQSLWGESHQKRSSQLDTLISRLKKELAGFPEIKVKGLYGTGYKVNCQSALY
jgi:DNA-binding response OmpR family regulator